MKLKILTILTMILLVPLMILTLTSCYDVNSQSASTSSSDATTSVSDDDTTDDSDPSEEDTPEDNEFVKKFIVKIDSGLYFSNGESLEYFLPATAHKVSPYNFVSDNKLIKLTPTGNIDSSSDLNHSPAAGLITENDFYSCVEVTPEEAQAAGARRIYHTSIFKNSVGILQHWSFNDFRCMKIIKSGDSIFIVDDTGRNHLINGTAEDIIHIGTDFYIHGMDSGLIYFNDGTADIQETYATNFILSAENWQKYGDLYYSENGYTWSVTDGLTEDATELYDFSSYPYPIEPPLIFGESPVFLAVGIADGLLYWIECATGFLFGYDSISDIIVQKYRLYVGDGLMVSGSGKVKTLKPLIVDGVLYFSDDGSLNKLDMVTGEVNIFNAGDGEVSRWD